MTGLSPLIAGAAALLLAVPAAANESPILSAARHSGIVGERFDGYLGFAAAAAEPVRRQVGSINIRRRTLYTGLATRRDVTVEAVGIAAGCALLADVAVGESYMLNDGAWRRRAPGTGAPVPAYCGD